MYAIHVGKYSVRPMDGMGRRGKSPSTLCRGISVEDVVGSTWGPGVVN